jgi:DNA repair protein RadD
VPDSRGEDCRLAPAFFAFFVSFCWFALPSLFASQQSAFTLRYYQQEAIDAAYRHLYHRDDNPLIVLPTGSGKTPVIATICRDAFKQWKARIIILAHVKELLQQSADKLSLIAPDVDFGIYSAGLKSRDTWQPVIVAGIQSVHDKACDLGRFDLAIIDEAHLIPPDGEGMYRSFLADARKINPNLRVLGLTATPFRMSSGLIATPDGILNSICYEIGIRELIAQGFLCPLVSKNGDTEVDRSQLHVRGGEYIPAEVEALFNVDGVVRDACQEIVERTRNRRKVLIFSAGVDHGLAVCNCLESLRQNVRFVTGDMPPAARDRIISTFPDDDGKYLVNVKVLTTGYDCPQIDCIALLHSTLSPGLYYQECGRGFRLHPNKKDCLILDFGGNIDEHGPIDLLTVEGKKKGQQSQAPVKDCPQCDAVIACGYSRCPHCGFEFPQEEKPRHDATASDSEILSVDEPFVVEGVSYAVHHKKGNKDATPTMRVDYEVGPGEFKSEWVCLEHKGQARQKARQWWRERSNLPIPETIEEAVSLARRGALADTFAIKYRTKKGEKFGRIIKHDIGDKPNDSALVSLPEDEF